MGDDDEELHKPTLGARWSKNKEWQ